MQQPQVVCLLISTQSYLERKDKKLPTFFLLYKRDKNYPMCTSTCISFLTLFLHICNESGGGLFMGVITVCWHLTSNQQNSDTSKTTGISECVSTIILINTLPSNFTTKDNYTTEIKTLFGVWNSLVLWGTFWSKQQPWVLYCVKYVELRRKGALENM